MRTGPLSLGTVGTKRTRRLGRALKIAGASLVGLVLLAVGFVYWYDRVGQKADLSFDTTVEKPTYTGDHPRLLFDAAHHNFHTPSGRYQPYADLLRNDGYVILENHLPFTPQVLDAAQVLVIANAMGPDDHEGRDAFSDDEKAAVIDWVQRGARCC